MADARQTAAAQLAMAAGPVHTAGGAGHIVFGAVRKNFQFIAQLHPAALLSGYKKYTRRISMVLEYRG